MNFFFDNNLPPALAHAVGALSKSAPHSIGQVIHLTDRFPRNTGDEAWIGALADEAGPWYVVSIDRFKKNHRAEREAIRKAGLTVYVLDPQWAHQQYWSKATRLIEWWPLILQHASLSAGGVYSVPWRRTNKSRLVAC